MGRSRNTISMPPVPHLVNDFMNEICRYSDNVASMKWDEKGSYQLISKPPYVTKVTTHDRLVPVVKLRSGFYIYASMSFDSGFKSRKHEFSDLSMHFFDDCSLLFRAEIANPKFHHQESWHPQPHWHIPGKRKEDVEKQQDSFKEFVIDSDISFSDYVDGANEAVKFDYGRLHLAMNYCKLDLESFDDSTIRTWIKQCLKSINDEFSFLAAKSHAVIV